MTLSQICRSSYQSPFAFPGGDIPEEIRRKFDQWWSNQLSPQSSMTPKMLPFMAGPPNTVTSDPIDHSMGTAALAAAAAAAAAAQAGLHAASSVGGPNVPGAMVPAMNTKRESLLMSDTTGHHPAAVVQGATAAAHHANMIVHPAMHASMHHHHHHSHHSSLTHSPFSNQKTRMRTSFDPEMELPRLQKWFQENPHPSRQQIQSYVVQLNALESRRGRKPLDVNNVVYWFKNARAAQKRAEMRGGLGVMHAAMNGYLSQHGQLGQTSGGSSTGSISSQQQLMSSGMGNLSLGNEFMKSPLSLKSEDIDTMSQHSDDLEEDNSRPGSPQLPLSLTMHERHHVRTDHDQEDNHNENLQRENLKDRSQVIEQYGNDTINPNECAEGANPHTEHNELSSNKEKPLEDHQSSAENVYSERQILKSEADTEGNNSNNSNANNTSSNTNPIINLDTENHHHQQLSPQANSPKDEDDELDMDEDDDDNDVSQLDDFRSPSPSPDLTNAMMAGGPRKDLPFPMVPNSMFSQSFMYMSHYMPGFGQAAAAAAHPHAAAAHHAAAAAAAAGMQPNPLMGAASGLNLSSISSEERRKRNRTFIDPVTEVPKLEQWFAMNTHPSHNLILKYTEDLNTMPYR